MLVEISNNVDKILNHQRFFSDKHVGMHLVIGLNESGNKFIHLLIEDIITFCTVGEMNRVIEAIAELKDFALSHQHFENQ